MLSQSYVNLFFILSCSIFRAQSLEIDLMNYINDPVVGNARHSFLAIDLNSGDTLFSYCPELPLTTASTTKIFATAMALELLGPEHRFATELFIDGVVKDSILQGNLWVKGGGDVSLGSRFFNAIGQEISTLESWVDSLKSKGIKGVNGTIYIDGVTFGMDGTPKGWSSWDIGNYYAAFPCGINFYDNAADYYFYSGKPGRKTKLIEIFPPQLQLNLDNQILSAKVKGDRSNLQGTAFNENRLATGKIPAYQSKFKVRGAVADPEQSFANVWSDVLKNKGFLSEKPCVGVRHTSVALPDYDCLSLVLRFPGKNVREIVKWTNGSSVNFFAEGLLQGVAYRYTGKGTNAKGCKVYQYYLKERMDTANLKLYDGSGLSRNNQISAGHFCDFLGYIRQANIYEEFKNSLPIAGVSGTLKELCKEQPCQGKVVAKSGTMTGIKSYAGYIFTASGKELAFAFISSGYTCSQSTVKAKMEVLLNRLSLY
ncbi:MAG: D-alanyl-D-alanine carboxypeptidase/D-alanyl-D-alanine-endopeptidase [Flavobacteriia bacterium]|nr:D-alanyl-D-alanine carboxypeptidase/D-alanyl-D-alanine-endopeptidase [Flavobacteriia bacterium]